MNTTPSASPPAESTAARFAITYTVKNEAALLPAAIAYHMALGCSRVYVFFDGTTDNSRELVGGLKNVVCADSVTPEALSEPPEWIKSLLPRWQENMDVRKRINTFVAARLALDNGIEWLINIDPDELILFDDPRLNRPGSHVAFFSSVPSEVDQILLPNLEAVPVGEGTGRPFLDCTLFLRRFSATENIWRITSALMRRLLRHPKLVAWYDYGFYWIRFRGALPRLMRHPRTGALIPAGYFLGYSNHKAFVRTGAARDYLFNIHKWQQAKKSPRTMRKGHVLHYDLCSVDYFASKFRQRQPTMLVSAFYCRYQFALIARDLPLAEIKQFFIENICIGDPTVVRRLRQRGILISIGFIANMMQNQAAMARWPSSEQHP